MTSSARHLHYSVRLLPTTQPRTEVGVPSPGRGHDRHRIGRRVDAERLPEPRPEFLQPWGRLLGLERSAPADGEPQLVRADREQAQELIEVSGQQPTVGALRPKKYYRGVVDRPAGIKPEGVERPVLPAAEYHELLRRCLVTVEPCGVAVLPLDQLKVPGVPIAGAVLKLQQLAQAVRDNGTRREVPLQLGLFAARHRAPSCGAVPRVGRVAANPCHPAATCQAELLLLYLDLPAAEPASNDSSAYAASSRNRFAIWGPVPFSSCLKKTNASRQGCSRTFCTHVFSSASP